MHGMFVMCPFSRNVECPKHVSLKLKGMPITNYLEVERQYPRTTPENTRDTNASIAVCLPAITNHVSTVSTSRLVEFIEANKLLGVTHLHTAHVNSAKYPNNEISEEQEEVLRFYEREGYLTKTDTASIYDSTTKIARGFAGVFRYMMTMCWTHCLIKNALKYDYIAVHDWDELVGVDLNRFSSVQDAILATRREHGMNHHSFNIIDTVFDHHCTPTAPALN